MGILGVTVKIENGVTPELTEKPFPDVLILAVGVEPMRKGLPGANVQHVLLAENCLHGKGSPGQSVIIIGGGFLGAELAEALADQGDEVIVLEQLESVAIQAAFIIKRELLKGLCQKGVKMLVDTKALSIIKERVIVERFGEKETLKADTIILAVGYQPCKELVQNLDISKMEFYQIGDCVRLRTIMEAIEEGNRFGLAI